jgi:hypothetical protein
MRITFPGGAVAEGSVEDCVQAIKRWGRETPAPKPAGAVKKHKRQYRAAAFKCAVCGKACKGAIGLGIHRVRYCTGPKLPMPEPTDVSIAA